MGLFDALLGNASEVDANELHEELSPIMFDGEVIERAFKVIRDMYVFTSARLILIDKQGMTGKKVEYLSIPYKSVSTFAVETAGHFDMDAELKMWVSGRHEPIVKELKKGSDVVGIQKLLATKVLA
ncbi:PH domain-containing protein [Halodesulfovibrio marinisediminis]|uniref:PH domain-containing protein n=1 Tax=Halodesulfovibrio marinisediminis DSM 17456 TaxID=1121457 RepID=A0A1N6I1H3_9BACT|nr:PH domain-containing protein [Halodesulfovibrio marinisediminis]SIO25908.1 PH domain-containing protein [Halodesulfovibrio marinisediminis DSM 17456]